MQLFSYSFDGFLTGCFTPLVSGSRVVLLRDNEILNLVTLKHCIQVEGITHFICVPALYWAILEGTAAEEIKSLRITRQINEKSFQEKIKEF